MVIYDLVCANFHTFEGWFKDSDDFTAQQEAGLVSCPACDNAEVKRKPSKLSIAGKKSNQISPADSPIHSSAEESAENVKQADSESIAMHFNSTEEQVNVLREFVEKNFEDVGDNFSEEIRKMHYGESDHRGIRGSATAEQVEDLAEEGIDTYALPMQNMSKNKLN